jgi:hypothetical protein
MGKEEKAVCGKQAIFEIPIGIKAPALIPNSILTLTLNHHHHRKFAVVLLENCCTKVPPLNTSTPLW